MPIEFRNKTPKYKFRKHKIKKTVTEHPHRLQGFLFLFFLLWFCLVTSKMLE
jgi:hypothetical protein